ncbi:MAG: hypothetical protein QMD20_03320 [Candidatus Bathyarchaeia archaeon]|nr:hypothetical protein [Candidatus Bathyarchaeia archaeon]
MKLANIPFIDSSHFSTQQSMREVTLHVVDRQTILSVVISSSVILFCEVRKREAFSQ